LFNGSVLADSTPTAFAYVNWAGITFSGAVAPAQISADFDWTTLVQANFTPPSSSESSNDWTTPLIATAPSFALASANDASLFTFVSIINSNINVADAERTGSIAAPDGTIEIDLPYSLQITNDFGYNSSTEVEVALATMNGDFFGNQEVLLLDPLGVSGNMEQQGIFHFVANGLSPGTYFFDVLAQSQIALQTSNSPVPEPSGILMLYVGLLCLVGMSLRKRFV
jgi:hypothetical protein